MQIRSTRPSALIHHITTSLHVYISTKTYTLAHWLHFPNRHCHLDSPSFMPPRSSVSHNPASNLISEPRSNILQPQPHPPTSNLNLILQLLTLTSSSNLNLNPPTLTPILQHPPSTFNVPTSTPILQPQPQPPPSTAILQPQPPSSYLNPNPLTSASTLNPNLPTSTSSPIPILQLLPQPPTSTPILQPTPSNFHPPILHSPSSIGNQDACTVTQLLSSLSSPSITSLRRYMTGRKDFIGRQECDTGATFTYFYLGIFCNDFFFYYYSYITRLLLSLLFL